MQEENLQTAEQTSDKLTKDLELMKDYITITEVKTHFNLVPKFLPCRVSLWGNGRHQSNLSLSFKKYQLLLELNGLQIWNDSLYQQIWSWLWIQIQTRIMKSLKNKIIKVHFFRRLFTRQERVWCDNEKSQGVGLWTSLIYTAQNKYLSLPKRHNSGSCSAKRMYWLF